MARLVGSLLVKATVIAQLSFWTLRAGQARWACPTSPSLTAWEAYTDDGTEGAHSCYTVNFGGGTSLLWLDAKGFCEGLAPAVGSRLLTSSQV